jgi:hypothetical protein
MATNYFSDLYAGLATASTLDMQKRASAGVSHGRIRYALCRFDPGEVVTINSIVRMKQFKSGDRIHSILLSSTDCGSAGDIDIGVYKSGAAHDGAVVDLDLFASAQDVNAAIRERLEVFDEAGLDDHDRGKTLWELNGDSVDPMEDWDLSIHVAEASTDTAWELTLEIFYTAGD